MGSGGSGFAAKRVPRQHGDALPAPPERATPQHAPTGTDLVASSGCAQARAGDRQRASGGIDWDANDTVTGDGPRAANGGWRVHKHYESAACQVGSGDVGCAGAGAAARWAAVGGELNGWGWCVFAIFGGPGGSDLLSITVQPGASGATQH
jgi:hypothetical protein